MKVQDVQSEFECVNHGDKLDNEHFAKHTAYFINNFKKDKPYLFPERNIKGKSGPKFINSLDEMLGLHVFATFRMQRTCRKIASFLKDNNSACNYLTNNKLPESQINKFKNEYPYLIDEFFKYTVEFGGDLKLVDFKIVTMDSTTVEASVDEYHRLKYEQVCYLENLIQRYGKSKGKRSIWNKIKRYFYYNELNDDIMKLMVSG